MSLKTHHAAGFLLAIALIAGGCSVLQPGDPACPPVDPGGDCFAPSNAAFAAHALTSASAWPQLDGLPIVAGNVLEAFDEAANQPTWIVSLLVEERVVAASRFLPHGTEVRLAEVVLYEPARLKFPTVGPGQRLVLFHAAKGCGEPIRADCLFINYGWRIDPPSN